MGDTKRVVLVLARRAESTRVAEFVEERFPSGGTPVILVFDNPDGLNKRDGAAIQDLGEWQRSDEAPELIDPNGIVSIITVSNAAASLVSEDGTTTMVVNLLGDPASDEYLEAVEAIAERTSDPPEGLEIQVSGPGGARRRRGARRRFDGDRT